MSTQSGIFSNSQAHPVTHATFDKGYIHNEPVAGGGEGLIDKTANYYEYNPVLSKPSSGINIYKYGTPMENNYPTDRRGPSFTPSGSNPFQNTGYPPPTTTVSPDVIIIIDPETGLAIGELDPRTGGIIAYQRPNNPAATGLLPPVDDGRVWTTAAPASTTAAPATTSPPATTTATPATTTAAPDDGGGGGGGY